MTVRVEEFSGVGYGNLMQLHNLGIKCVFLTVSIPASSILLRCLSDTVGFSSSHD